MVSPSLTRVALEEMPIVNFQVYSIHLKHFRTTVLILLKKQQDVLVSLHNNSKKQFLTKSFFFSENCYKQYRFLTGIKKSEKLDYP